jgi:hypothetical protein
LFPPGSCPPDAQPPLTEINAPIRLSRHHHRCEARTGDKMSHVPHELHEEFPDAADILHKLKLGDAHFARLAERHHEINREIHRIESGVEAASDERTEALKRERLSILDQVAAIIADARREATA